MTQNAAPAGPEAGAPGAGVYAGLFLATLATLMFEILLTRIFSITLWHHFAFVAISVAMFGMTAGALAVHLLPARFPPERTRQAMAWSAAAFGVTLVAAVLGHLALPTESVYRLSATYLVASVPFVCSGICVCLALTRYPRSVGRLYAVDLAGAALGCVALVVLLGVMDGISAVFATAALAFAAALAWAPAPERRLRTAAAALAALFCGLAAVNNVAAHRQAPLFAIHWTKRGGEVPPVYERWNAFSRITVHAYQPTDPLGWGLSPKFRPERKVPLAWLIIDAGAGTLLTEFKGDLREVDYLRLDSINLAHYLRPGAKTAVIGAGGGRDVLSALLFKAPEVVALEFNGVILDTVHGRYGDFTGHLDRIPGVRFVHDEARSWFARSSERFDLIQASWIDTHAMTAAGAFVLTENSLYTREAWRIFLDHLSPAGILTFSRYYNEENPREAARLTALARAALVDRGVADPERHIMLVVTRYSLDRLKDRSATILVSPAPFSDADVARLKAVCDDLQFDLIVAPGLRDAAPALVRAAVTGQPLSERSAFAYSIVAPTDDRPFFFNMLSLTSLADPAVRGMDDPNVRVAKTLLWLLATVAVLAALCVALPLTLAPAPVRPAWSARDARLVLYFAAIGLGFMFVEIALLQRLSLFLGHPTYALGVLLFGLLLSSGAGSYFAGRGRAGAPRVLGAAALLVAAVALGLPRLTSLLQGEPTALRIAASLAVIAPLGLLMGMAFPFGVGAARREAAALLPWLWAVNGAASVLASVVAVAVALELGIGAGLWIGAACYLAAALAARRAPAAAHVTI